jgi:hypothetical protein
MEKTLVILLAIWVAISLAVNLSGALFTSTEKRGRFEYEAINGLIFITVAAVCALIYGSRHWIVFLGGLGLAVVLFLWRIRYRAIYGIGEIVFGVAVLWDAAYKGRGDFNSDFSNDFSHFELSVILIQTFGAVYVLIRGMDNVLQGLPEQKRKSFEARVRQWALWRRP